jgi:hypothetical protein
MFTVWHVLLRHLPFWVGSFASPSHSSLSTGLYVTTTTVTNVETAREGRLGVVAVDLFDGEQVHVGKAVHHHPSASAPGLHLSLHNNTR